VGVAVCVVEGGVLKCGLEITKRCLEGVGEGLDVPNVRFNLEATLDSNETGNHMLRGG
jgi:hypothetical protein